MKTLSRRQIGSRVRRLIAPVREMIEASNPRPSDYPYDMGWSLAFEVDQEGVCVTAWSVAPGMLRPFDEVIEGRLVARPWTEEGAAVFDSLCERVTSECGVPCRVTYMPSIWENT